MSSYNEHARTCKRHHMDIMDDYLASIGCKRKPIPKDGSCLFRAFSEQAFKTQAHHLYIREACIRYMKRNQPVFENFVDDPFDEYLHKMSNPKESADQIEISALSKMYSCDFYIYERPGQSAKNVTENDYCYSVYLCHSGQKHYDSVYPVQYFDSYGICQSIIYSILFQNVLGISEAEEKKSVNTFRMLCSPQSSESKENNEDNVNDEDNNSWMPSFTISSIYQPSIGILSTDIPPQDQLGLAYKLPISLDFVRGLDPSVFRNTDYDFWITIKRKQQYIHFSVAEGMQYLIGDRCLVVLSIYSKSLVSHVQEVSPDNGPITVFIEALGGMHTIAVKNAKPLDSFSGACRNDVWPSKWRRRPPLGETSWSYSRNSGGGGRRYSKSRELDSGDFSFNQRNMEYNASLQKRSQNGFSDSNGERGHYSSKTDLSRRSIDDYSPRKPQRYRKSRWGGNQRPASPHHSPPVVNEQQTNLPDDMWADAAADYSGNKSNWIESTEQLDQSKDNLYEESYPEEQWKDVDCNIMGDSNGSTESNNTVYLNPNTQSTPPQDPEPQQLSYNEVPCQQGEQNITDEMANMGITEYQAQHSAQLESDGGVFVPQTMGQCEVMQQQPPPGGATGSVVNLQRPPGYVPYSGTITMIDAEGKEMMFGDNKNPFQYFYNLGLEYYRQLSGSSQRSAPLVVGNPSVPPYQNIVQQSPLVQPQHMGYIHPGNPHTQFTHPQVQHPGGCVATIPHFHPVLIPPSSNLGGQYQAGRLIVHVPPPVHHTPQHPQHPMQVFAAQQQAPLHNEDARPHDNSNVDQCQTEGGALVQPLTHPHDVTGQHQATTATHSAALPSPNGPTAPVYHPAPTYVPQIPTYAAPPAYNPAFTAYDHGVQGQNYHAAQSVQVQNSGRGPYQA